MTPRELYKNNIKTNKEVLERIATDAGTTFANFQQIAICGGSVSSALAKRLEEASDGQMTKLEILFPEEFEHDSQKAG